MIIVRKTRIANTLIRILRMERKNAAGEPRGQGNLGVGTPRAVYARICARPLRARSASECIPPLPDFRATPAEFISLLGLDHRTSSSPFRSCASLT